MLAPAHRSSLAHLPPGIRARIVAVDLPQQEVDWLRALGIFDGQRLTVVRRALFGGPLHVRAASGGEFAIDRSLAGFIEVERDGEERT